MPRRLSGGRLRRNSTYTGYGRGDGAVGGLFFVAGVEIPSGPACAASPTAPRVSFSEDVLPLLKFKCPVCHLPGGEGYDKSGFDISSYETLMKGTKFGPMVIPGDPELSNLMRCRLARFAGYPYAARQEANVHLRPGFDTRLDRGWREERLSLRSPGRVASLATAKREDASCKAMCSDRSVRNFAFVRRRHAIAASMSGRRIDPGLELQAGPDEALTSSLCAG